MKNNNSVAFISKIKSLKSIENADKIEAAKVEGWESIVQKDIHKVGDLVLCITTDAVIPQDLAEKWGVINYLRKGNRVRTVKLKSQLSECILIPQSEIFDDPTNGINEGDDMMGSLNIYKYEPPAKVERLPNGKQIRQEQNPNFHVYYKFQNAKNVPNLFQEEDTVEVTRKIHGTNARYGIVKKNKITIIDRIKRLLGNKWAYHEFVYGSHNVQKVKSSKGYYPDNVWYKILKEYNIDNKLWKYVKFKYEEPKSLDNFIIYGEIYGPGIQGKHYIYNKDQIDFAGFDVEFNNQYLNSTTKALIISIDLELPMVPKLYIGNYHDDLLTMYNNDKINGTDIYHEGVVISCTSGSRNKIMKVVSPNYLIKAEKLAVPDSH